MSKIICIIAGARPNFIKVSPLVREINRRQTSGDRSLECYLVYTGCEDDPTLEPSLFEDLQITRPQYFLGVGSSRLNVITSEVMARFDRFLDDHPVDVVIVVDDLNMPKEINRLVIDALSDYLFTAGVRSTGVATREQSEQSQTFMVGNILMDTLRFNRDRLKKPASLPDIQEGQYIVFTLNRKALLADKDNLSKMILAMTKAAGSVPIVAPLRDYARKELESLEGKLLMISPLSYLEFGWLTAHAKGVITDSGNVAEEATFNGVPCITLNDYTEHQETVTVGSNVLVGEDPERLSEAVTKMVRGSWKHCALPDRWDGRTADRILQILLSND